MMPSAAVGAWDLNTLHAYTDEREFVLIAHGDCHKSFASKIDERLTECGIPCLMEGTQSHVEMSDRIHIAKEAILRCGALIVILSNRTAKSELLQDQLAFAEDKGRRILPVLLNEVALGLDNHYTLSRMELFHFASQLGFQSSMKTLLTSLRKHIQSMPRTGSYDALVAERQSFVRARRKSTILGASSPMEYHRISEE